MKGRHAQRRLLLRFLGHAIYAHQQEAMTARKLGPHSQRSHIKSCRRFDRELNVYQHEIGKLGFGFGDALGAS